MRTTNYLHAITCMQKSPLDGATKLARLVLRAAEKRLPSSPMSVLLDEALGDDATIFAGAGPFLPAELAIVVLRGSQADCESLARAIVRGSKKVVVTRSLITPPVSLRVQAVLSPEGCVLAEESPFFDGAAAKVKRLPIRRVPAEMLTVISVGA
ncbi:MAG: hypothetical protein IT381_32375 [Deltaproteobacteria bacterium]|nr:hypothetical protein [Deltaproteobacteria bacterium]